MEQYPKLIIKYPFKLVEMNDETVAVATQEGTAHFSGMIKLKEESSKFIFEHLQKGINLPDMIFLCLKKYPDSSIDDVGPMVIEFINTLKKEGLLAVVPNEI